MVCGKSQLADMRARPAPPSTWREAVERAEKVEMVEELGHVFAESGSVVIARYTGLTVAQMTVLRQRMNAAGARFKVVKNRLAKIALENTDRGSAADMFTDPTGIAFAQDPVAPAKVAIQFAKENDKFIIIGGIVGKGAVDPAGIKALAEMPSIDELRARLVGVLNAPASNLVRVLNAPGEKLVRTINAPAADLVGVLQARKQQLEAA
jgi:large subunit ribosomal protein L10